MASNDEVLARWMTEAGREDPHYLHRGGHLFVGKNDRVLFFDPTGDGRRGRQHELLARFVGARYDKRGYCLLNGDGFDGVHERNATAWQTRVREEAQRLFTWQRCPIIPYQALNGAGIVHESIKLVHVTQETNDQAIHEIADTNIDALFSPVPAKAVSLGFRRTDGNSHDVNHRDQFFEGTINGHRFQVRYQQDRYANSDSWSISQWLWAQPTFGQPGWQLLRAQRSGTIAGQRAAIYAWIEMIHRLGAVVFTAQYQGSSARHRFISDFDMQEPGGLYYLAQLPRTGACNNYDDAISLLAPPMVHMARANGTPVVRQGDVFAIQIEHPDEWVYEDAEFIVRREVVLANHQLLQRQGLLPPEPHAHEVREKGTCPFCKCRPWVGNGTKARRALMIHGTAHTATEVVVKKDGRTFVRGTMHHDPRLETAGREPEHRDLILMDKNGKFGETWFFALRNTVPRVRNTPQAVTEPANDTDPGRRSNEQNQRHERHRQEQRPVPAAAAF